MGEGTTRTPGLIGRPAAVKTWALLKEGSQNAQQALDLAGDRLDLVPFWSGHFAADAGRSLQGRL